MANSQEQLNAVTGENGYGLKLQSFNTIYKAGNRSRIKYRFYVIPICLFLFLFLPWTQNIRSSGFVTALRQEQRPQQLNTIIPGKVAKWYVKEGDYVEKGDTIIQLAEIKDDYLDPALLERTGEQLDAKRRAAESYQSKVATADLQILALMRTKDLKISEFENKISQQFRKIKSDSAELEAFKNDFSMKATQFQRQRIMYDSGLVSLTQLEMRRQSVQEAEAKKTASEIKFNNSKQELLRLQIEQNGMLQEYAEKVSKAEGDRFQSLSQIAGTEAEVAKLQNQYMNYNVRSGLYFITAPQSGQVVRAKKAGIGEIVKDGEMIVEIVPNESEFAVELFVDPVDLPLLSKGQRIQFIFDGFPAIVFSGWPQASYGIFEGKIVAIESSVSDNGKFRILAAEDPKMKKWPKQLKMGTGAQGIALLKDVPIWYELWRNINGFPPDYYKPKTDARKDKK